MPPAKRKVPTKGAAKKAKGEQQVAEPTPKETVKRRPVNPVATIVTSAQINEAFHIKYVKELQQIYLQIGHDRYMECFVSTLKQLMMQEETNPFANTGLKFMAKMATSYEGEDAHPILVFTFNWLLSTVSLLPHIRFRICQFVNMLLNALSSEATLDDTLCDDILKYMSERLKDVSATVRVQALTALQRLQMPDVRDDPVVKFFQYHLNNDPSPIVRQAVITAIGRNVHTVPFILDRFWDVDDKVRRHAYLHMSSYSVRSYKVAQRLTFLEQGLNDQSPMVRKVVVSVLIPSWLETYNKDYIAFVGALKLDANEQDIDRFRKTAKLALFEIFNMQPMDNLIAGLRLPEEGDFALCIPLDRLTVESSLYWFCLAEFCSTHDDYVDRIDEILPDLTIFCNYVSSYFERTNEDQMDVWQKLEHNYILMTLVQMMNLFDLSDEKGRSNLKSLITEMLSREEFDETIVAKVIECLELLIPDPDQRLQYVADIIHNLVDVSQSANVSLDLNTKTVIDLLERNPNLKVKVSSIKLRIMDLKEEETNCVKDKDYNRAEQLKEELVQCNEQLTQLLAPYIDGLTPDPQLNATCPIKRVYNQEVVRCIQMAFFVVRSKNVLSLIPAMSSLFKSFIRRQIEVKNIAIRGWALKCSISFSLLYEQLAKDVFVALYKQFVKHPNPSIWAISISGLIELIDRYGFDFFQEEPSENGEACDKRGANTLKKSRQLYSEDGQDTDEDEMSRRPVDIMYLFDSLDDCTEQFIQYAVLDGYARLILHDHINDPSYMSKLMLKFFNPMTEPDINQMLAVFFENLVNHNKQESLQQAMLPTLFIVLEAPPDSPLQEIKPESILQFVINATLPTASNPGLNIHNTIAMSFLDTMSTNIINKELLRYLAKAALSLEISDDPILRKDLKVGLDKLLESDQIESRTVTRINMMKMKLDGISVNDTNKDLPDIQEENNADNDDEATTAHSPSVGGSTNTVRSPNANKSPIIAQPTTIPRSPTTACSPVTAPSPTAAQSPNVVRSPTIVQTPTAVSPAKPHSSPIAVNKSPVVRRSPPKTPRILEKDSDTVIQATTPSSGLTRNRPRRQAAANALSHTKDISTNSKSNEKSGVRAKRKNDMVTKSPPLNPLSATKSKTPVTISRQDRKKLKQSVPPPPPPPIRRSLQYTDTPLITTSALDNNQTSGRRSNRFSAQATPSTGSPARRSLTIIDATPQSPSTSSQKTPARSKPRNSASVTSGGSSSKENHGTDSTNTSPNGTSTQHRIGSVVSPNPTPSPKILSPKTTENNRRTSPVRKSPLKPVSASPIRKRLVSPKNITRVPVLQLKRTIQTSSTDSSSYNSPPSKRVKYPTVKLKRLTSSAVKRAAQQSTPERKRTRNETVEEILRTSIITRKRNSLDKTALLGTTLNRSTGLVGGSLRKSTGISEAATPSQSKRTTNVMPRTSRIPRLKTTKK